jgi:P pilus assembly chaperone PapD
MVYRGNSVGKCGLAGLIVSLFLGTAIPARGQIYFGISPIRAEHKIKPGESLTDVFMVRNNASGPIRIKVYCENWTLRSDGTASFIGATATSYSGRDWIIVNPQDFRLNPGETKSVRYTITVPPDAPAAGYHASVSFETVPEANAAQSGNRMLFTGKIAAAVYITVGKVAVEGNLLDLKIGSKDNGPTIILELANTGRTHFRTRGTIRVFDSGGRKISDLDIPDDVVLPEGRRDVACALPNKLDPGSYRVVCRLDIGRAEMLEMERTIRIEK